MRALLLSLAIGVAGCSESSIILQQPKSAPVAAVSGFKVTILGACGGIGMPLSMLMKMDEQVSELSLYDVVRTAGVAADISHICTNVKVCGYTGGENLRASLAGSDMVVITAGVPRKPGMTRDDLFEINAKIMKDLAEGCADSCPDAMFLIVSNPVNSLVPLFAEVLKRAGVYRPSHLFGLSSLDAVRARTFAADALQCDVNDARCAVTVIGGHAGTTILPLLSQSCGELLSVTNTAALSHRVQFAGDEIVAAKDGNGSATLSMAFAAHRFASRLLTAMRRPANEHLQGGGKEDDGDVVECAYVENSLTAAPFFAAPLRLGPSGIEEVLHFGSLSAAEQSALNSLVPTLIEEAEKGVAFARRD